MKYLSIPKSTYYYKRKNKGKKKRKRRKNYQDKWVIEKIIQIKGKHPYWGYRRVWAYMRKKLNMKINHKRVYRLMKENSLLNTKEKKIAIRKVRPKIKVNEPRRVIGIDATSVYTKDMGWVYYIAVIDWGSREILGSVISIRNRSDEWIEALNIAINEGYPEGIRGKGMILVSDNGSQPRSRAFVRMCKELGIKQVFTSYNNPRGNANTERYFRTYKEEVIWPEGEMTFEELKEKTMEFEKFYNEEYPHSAIGYKSPSEVYKEWLSHSTNVA